MKLPWELLHTLSTLLELSTHDYGTQQVHRIYLLNEWVKIISVDLTSQKIKGIINHIQVMIPFSLSLKVSWTKVFLTPSTLAGPAPAMWCGNVTRTSFFPTGFRGHDSFGGFPSLGNLAFCRSYVFIKHKCLHFILEQLLLTVYVEAPGSSHVVSFLSALKIARFPVREDSSQLSCPKGEAEEVRKSHVLCFSISLSLPFSLVPANTRHWLTAMAWIQLVGEALFMQLTGGPRTLLRFLCHWEHFVASGLDTAHHRTLLLRAARHSPGREGTRSKDSTTDWGSDHCTLWYEFSRLLPLSQLPSFPLHFMATSSHSP